MMTLTPAYGRDYKSAKAAKADFAADKDFVINDIMSPDDGRYVNRSQLSGQTVMLRFKELRNTTVVKVK
jgi:hypothetical protein